LLKSLDHNNIVRYIDHIKKEKELNIVMEYVENGSLAHMVKKCGRFPESLAKTYTRKVLVGLDYLHDQGICGNADVTDKCRSYTSRYQAR
jgi:serine/threonine protein kinase